VDEDVDLTTLAEVAADLGGELIDFRYVEVWRPRDYFYAAIQKGAPDRLASRRPDVPRNESVGSRLARVSPLPWGDEVRGVIESVRRSHRLGRRMARGIRSLIFRS
jgi:hypothetical protein